METHWAVSSKLSIFSPMKKIIIVALMLWAVLMSLLCWNMRPDRTRRGRACLVGTAFGYIQSEDQQNWLYGDRRYVEVLYIDANKVWHTDFFPYQLVQDLSVIDVDDFKKKK